MTDQTPARPTDEADRTNEGAVQPDLAPEAHNSEQDDEPAQAQALASEALDRATAVLGDADGSERTGDDGDEPGDGTPDLVDHMKQMVSSGRLDFGAYRGERNDDDEEQSLGEAGIDDDTPRGPD